MTTLPPKPTPPIGPDPHLHLCEVVDCGKFGPLGHHEIRGDQMIEHWRCIDHKHVDWPKAI